MNVNFEFWASILSGGAAGAAITTLVNYLISRKPPVLIHKELTKFFNVSDFRQNQMQVSEISITTSGAVTDSYIFKDIYFLRLEFKNISKRADFEKFDVIVSFPEKVKLLDYVFNEETHSSSQNVEPISKSELPTYSKPITGKYTLNLCPFRREDVYSLMFVFTTNGKIELNEDQFEIDSKKSVRKKYSSSTKIKRNQDDSDSRLSIINLIIILLLAIGIIGAGIYIIFLQQSLN